MVSVKSLREYKEVPPRLITRWYDSREHKIVVHITKANGKKSRGDFVDVTRCNRIMMGRLYTYTPISLPYYICPRCGSESDFDEIIQAMTKRLDERDREYQSEKARDHASYNWWLTWKQVEKMILEAANDFRDTIVVFRVGDYLDIFDKEK